MIYLFGITVKLTFGTTHPSVKWVPRALSQGGKVAISWNWPLPSYAEIKMYSLLPTHSFKLSYFFFSLSSEVWGSSKHETVPTCCILCSARLNKLQFRALISEGSPNTNKKNHPWEKYNILLQKSEDNKWLTASPHIGMMEQSHRNSCDEQKRNGWPHYSLWVQLCAWCLANGGFYVFV
jgi:hypothetical protein